MNDLRPYIRTRKDELNRFLKKSVVYQIPCKDCDVTCIRQTKKQLNIRIQEHKKDINKSSTLSVISAHRLDYNKNMDWEGVKIIDRESSYQKNLSRRYILKDKKWS